jgi:uridine kinase
LKSSYRFSLNSFTTFLYIVQNYNIYLNVQVAEPVLTGTIEPTDVIIIEGIYAQAPEITKGSDLQYEMTTPLATCIGRRLLRDIAERPEFADPATSLGYMLSEAEPAYRAQVTARRGQS